MLCAAQQEIPLWPICSRRSQEEEVELFARLEWRFSIGALICLGMLGAPNRAAAQYNQWFTMDCSGITPGAYTSINSVSYHF